MQHKTKFIKESVASSAAWAARVYRLGPAAGAASNFCRRRKKQF